MEGSSATKAGPGCGKLIAIALPSLLPLGGTESMAIKQADRFLRLGYSVDLILASELLDVAGSVSPGVRVFNFGAARLRDSIRPLVNYLRREKPDAMHVTMWPFSSIGLLAHRLARSPAGIVVSDHNMLSVQYGDRSLLYRMAMRASMALTYPWAHGRVAVSTGVADDIAALSTLPRSKFTVIHNPLTLPDADTTTSDQAEAAWGGWGGHRIITVGRFKAQKNHALLIRAFKRLCETVDARLMILGVGELEDATRALVEAEGLRNKVVMTGQVADPAPYYHAANLFVLSSNYEGFGNVLVEALSCGVPVVSTDCPSGPSEILEGGRWGRLTPVGDAEALADAMAEALAEDHDRNALRRRAADFSPEINAQRYLDLLQPTFGRL